MKKVISTTSAPAAIGPYSQAVETGNMIFLSGQLPIDPKTGIMPEGIKAQTRQAFANIKAILAEAGYSVEHIVKTSPLLRWVFRLAPYILTALFFTAIYIFIPNTKVKFKYAFISGLICGTVFQIFQFIYISGQIWVSKYNAIYGSFAFLPLLLIWMQFSWLICLFGAVLTYSSQNVVNFNFEKETNDISRRYSDYIILVIATVIVHRFKEGLPPMTKGQISRRYAIPIQLVERTVDELERVNIISQTLSEEERVPAYQPAVDISRLTLGYLLRAIDREGDEDFICNLKADFPKEWAAIIDTRRLMEEKGDSIALKDLKIEESRVLSHKLNNNE